MDYSIYKMEFYTETHFGKGMLNESSCAFQADTLFSALYIEALKMGCADEFYHMAKEGGLRFSDAFPYLGDQYLLPKPIIHVESADRGNAEEKKRWKKRKYLPAEQLGQFLKGTAEADEDPMGESGEYRQRTMASVRTNGDTEPYHVRVFQYYPGNGLYILVRYGEERQKVLAENLLDALSYTGIGGKKASGLGKFRLKTGKRAQIFDTGFASADLSEEERKTGKQTQVFDACPDREPKRYMLLSGALPADSELEEALEGSSYLLERRSGFVASASFAEEYRKKRDLFVFAAGSCFEHRFEGDIYDVSPGGGHPVYRYAKPLFMGMGR